MSKFLLFLSILSILGGVLILIHQLVTNGNLVNFHDVFHHEWFAGVSIAFGLGLGVWRRGENDR